MRSPLGGTAGNRFVERFVISRVHRFHKHAPMCEIFVQQRIGAAVDILADHNAIARLEDGQHRVNGGQAGPESESACAMLKLCDLLFQEFAGRIAAARIIPTGHGLNRFESISGRVVDRRIHGSGVIVVDRQSVNKLSVESGHDAHPLGSGQSHAFHAISTVIEQRMRQRNAALPIDFGYGLLTKPRNHAVFESAIESSHNARE